MEKYNFREGGSIDVELIYEIEKLSIDDPWSYELIENDLIKNVYSKYFVVTDIYDNVLGFCATMLIIDEVHITNIAIHPNYRGKGLGKELLKYSIDDYSNIRIKGVTLEVNVNNEVAINLYKDSGFEIVGKRPGYYSNNQDAYIMWKYIEENSRC